jgi:imidazolonepropionase-like amidohydrolase
LLPGRAVVVSGPTITAVVAAEGFQPPPGATVVAAEGKYLIPGLWDMHVHHEFPWPGLLELALANGVTGVRDLNSEPFVLAWREEIRAGKRLGPRIVASGKRLDARLNGQPPRTVSADTPDEGRNLVRARRTEGADLIKVYSGLSPEVYRAIVAEAKAQNLPVAGHCPERVSAFDASRLGQRSIEHLTGVAVSCSRGEVALREQLAAAFTGPNGYDIDATFPVIETAMATPDEQKQAALFAEFKKNRTWQVPTLVVQRPLPPPGAAPDPRLKYTHWAVAQLWERIRANDKHGKFRERSSAYARATVRAMHQAGVPLLAGTDAGGAINVGIVPGFSLADELELLVECGLAPADALRTATLNPALYLGEEATAGTVAEGKRADLVLLDADPLAAIGNVRKITGVMAHGRWLPRPELDKLLDGVAASATQKK